MLSSILTLFFHCCLIIGKESDKKWEEEVIMKKEETSPKFVVVSFSPDYGLCCIYKNITNCVHKFPEINGSELAYKILCAKRIIWKEEQDRRPIPILFYQYANDKTEEDIKQTRKKVKEELGTVTSDFLLPVLSQKEFAVLVFISDEWLSSDTERNGIILKDAILQQFKTERLYEKIGICIWLLPIRNTVNTRLFGAYKPEKIIFDLSHYAKSRPAWKTGGFFAWIDGKEAQK